MPGIKITGLKVTPFNFLLEKLVLWLASGAILSIFSN